MLARRSLGAAAVWTLAVVSAFTLLRMAISPLVSGLPYVTYFPAVLIIAAVFGWRWGVLALVLCAALANYIFVPPEFSFAFGIDNIAGTFAFVVSTALLIVTAEALRTAVRELDERSQREMHLNAELQHRVKNILMVAQGLALQTARATPAPEAFYEAFSGRVQALAEAQDVLRGRHWEVAELPQLAERALKPFIGRAVELSGPACTIPVAACVPLVLALHELGTNAVKYGALSAPDGKVTVRWSVEGTSDLQTLVLLWTEHGGPEVTPPKHKGFGSRLLRAQPGLEAVRLEFLPSGVTCGIVVKGARLPHP